MIPGPPETWGEDASGFPGADAAHYKLSLEEFDRHLNSLDGVGDSSLEGYYALLEGGQSRSLPLMLTFDDGGASACPLIAERLERHGRRGFFFITTDYLDRPGFLTKERVRALRRRGHVIGSHSRSHPLRMASRSWDELLREWGESVRILSEILEEPVRVASIPGGQFSRPVAKAAARSGIKVLFTSEPTASLGSIDGCVLLGRYAITQGVSPATAAALASGRFAPRFKQYFFWNLKKAVKTLGGEAYLKVRRALRERSAPHKERLQG